MNKGLKIGLTVIGVFAAAAIVYYVVVPATVPDAPAPNLPTAPTGKEPLIGATAGSQGTSGKPPSGATSTTGGGTSRAKQIADMMVGGESNTMAPNYYPNAALQGQYTGMAGGSVFGRMFG